MSEQVEKVIPHVQGFKFLLVYVDELEPCQAFYEKYLGFKQTAEFSLGEIYGTLGDVEMWMGAAISERMVAKRRFVQR